MSIKIGSTAKTVVSLFRSIFQNKAFLKDFEAGLKEHIAEGKSVVLSGGQVDAKGNYFLIDSDKEGAFKGLVVSSMIVDQEKAIKYIKENRPEMADALIQKVEKVSADALLMILSKEKVYELGLADEQLSLKVTEVTPEE